MREKAPENGVLEKDASDKEAETRMLKVEGEDRE